MTQKRKAKMTKAKPKFPHIRIRSNTDSYDDKAYYHVVVVEKDDDFSIGTDFESFEQALKVARDFKNCEIWTDASELRKVE